LLFFPTAAATAKAYTVDRRRWRGVRVRKNDGKKKPGWRLNLKISAGTTLSENPIG